MGRALRILGAFGLLAALVWFATAWMAPLPARLDTASSTVVTYADGSTAHVFLAPDDRWRIAPHDVDPLYLEALIRYEDKRFWWHGGTDPIAVLRAIAVNLLAGEVRTGASTLTSQVVRVLEPRPRTLWSKLVESHRALTLELHLSKDTILDAYLRFAPFGGNLEGVEAASLALFGHSADALAPDEIAILLAIPQNPSLRPSPRHAERLREARDRIGAFLVEAGVFDDDQGRAVREAEIPTRLRSFPREIPHLAQRLRERHAPGARIPTTLDRGVQRIVAARLEAERELLRERGIHNGAAVVVEHATHEVRAIAGNIGFLEDGRALQVPAYDVPRSPGSALKPFLYAMALDQGRFFPATRVPDVPRRWSGYTPKNYDGRFRGLVPIEEALALSLNLPFVELLADTGVETFLGTLRTLGARSLHEEPGYYGLSSIVGGLEITPLELAGMYATLADHGRYTPLRLQPGPRSAAIDVFSPASAHLTAEALRERDRPGFPARRSVTGVGGQIAWKTGTSFGHRDAWAAGFGNRYTAVVWLGNLDNRPARALVGNAAAGPILFDIIEALEGRSAPEPVHDDRVTVELCALSGLLPTDACPHRIEGQAPRRSVPTARCSLHVTLPVDIHTGEALAPGCRRGRSWEERTFVVWPAAVRRYLEARDLLLPTPPPYAEGCAPADHPPPVITSPEQGQVAVLIPGLAPDEQEIPFAAEAPGALSWFVDGVFLGTRPGSERVWWTPTPGAHTLVVQDALGREARVGFRVVEPTDLQGAPRYR